MGYLFRLELGRTYFAFLLLEVVFSIETCENYNQVHGERFVGPVVAIVTTVGLQQCIKECLSRPGVCGGVNYRKTQLLCEIVTATDTTKPFPEYVRIILNDVSITRAFFYILR
jgi:predicted transcriptional regulator of viral defense system